MENTKFWQNEQQKKISVGMANDIVNLKKSVVISHISKYMLIIHHSNFTHIFSKVNRKQVCINIFIWMLMTHLYLRRMHFCSWVESLIYVCVCVYVYQLYIYNKVPLFSIYKANIDRSEKRNQQLYRVGDSNILFLIMGRTSSQQPVFPYKSTNCFHENCILMTELPPKGLTF